MSTKNKIKPGHKAAASNEGKHRRQKEPTQKTPQQRILIMGSNGKFRLEWRDWPAGSK